MLSVLSINSKTSNNWNYSQYYRREYNKADRLTNEVMTRIKAKYTVIITISVTLIAELTITISSSYEKVIVTDMLILIVKVTDTAIVMVTITVMVTVTVIVTIYYIVTAIILVAVTVYYGNCVITCVSSITLFPMTLAISSCSWTGE